MNKKKIFISTTNKGPVGELDYYLALEKLKQFSVGEKDGYLIINPLTLEEQMGTNLFIRKRDGVTLTETGELFYKKIKNAMELIQQLLMFVV